MWATRDDLVDRTAKPVGNANCSLWPSCRNASSLACTSPRDMDSLVRASRQPSSLRGLKYSENVEELGRRRGIMYATSRALPPLSVSSLTSN